MQKPDVALSKALEDIRPFRGECAGALELSVLLGCLHARGAETVDAFRASYGPAVIGAWSLSGAGGRKDPIDTLARHFLTNTHKVPATYDRGSVIAVPGDYLYFQNKDDYPTHAPSGGWQGENCIYMGQDALGDPHYSGLGLGWKSEFALRMFLGNAYFNDANAVYLDQRRKGDASDIIPAIIDDPIADVRFTARAIICCPEITQTPAPTFQFPRANASPLSADDIKNQLDLLGFVSSLNGGLAQSEIRLDVLMDALACEDQHLRPVPSAGANSAGLVVQLDHWVLRLEPIDPTITHLKSDDVVRVHAQSVS